MSIKDSDSRGISTTLAVERWVGQGRVGQGRVGQGRVGQGRVGQGRVGQGRVGQGRVGQGRVGQGRVGQGRVGQGRVGQGRVGQGRVGQVGQGRVGQGRFHRICNLSFRAEIPSFNFQRINRRKCSPCSNGGTLYVVCIHGVPCVSRSSFNIFFSILSYLCFQSQQLICNNLKNGVGQLVGSLIALLISLRRPIAVLDHLVGRGMAGWREYIISKARSVMYLGYNSILTRMSKRDLSNMITTSRVLLDCLRSQPRMPGPPRMIESIFSLAGWRSRSIVILDRNKGTLHVFL